MRLVSRASWIVVVAVALAISWWSLAAVARHYGLPWIPAAGLSTVFDGAALVASSIALSHAQRHGDSGTGARVTVMLLVASSAFLNADHAAILRDRLPAYLLFATPPVVAWLIFELHTRWVRRDALIAAGRTARPLPVFGHPVWLDHPLSTYRARRRITAAHRDQAALAGTFTYGEALRGISSRADAIRLASAATASADPAVVFAWITQHRAYIPARHQAIDQAFIRKALGQIERRTEIAAPDPLPLTNGSRSPQLSLSSASASPRRSGGTDDRSPAP